MSTTAVPRMLTVIEDGGLGAMVRPSTIGNGAAPGAITPEILQAARDLLLDRIPVGMLDPVAPAGERNPAVLQVLRQEIGTQLERGYGPLREVPADEATLLRLFRETLGWGPAQPYLDDERIQEVKIIGDLIMVQEDGADFTLVPERFVTTEEALDRAALLAARLGVPLNSSKPQSTLPLAYGTRMHVTIPPCTPEKEALICIRRGRRYAWVLDDVLKRGAFSKEVYDLLQLFARATCSFLIAGETGSGKTALLEAIVNSWPGEPHVITIEDNTLEINVKHAAWTRELVQTATEPGAFGRAAKEVLRQTPSIVAPGETRAAEGGAILAVAVSGHAVITTLHAKSAIQAVSRFADCAAMPDAYSYAGRRDNALEDTCDNIEVVIHVEKLGGRRYISEIVLLNGVEEQGGRLRPRVVPLVEMVIDDLGDWSWRCAARVEGDTLVWKSGKDITPDGLRSKLRLLKSSRAVRSASTTRMAIEETITRATQAVQAGQADQALAMLKRAWADRPDDRLISAAQQALEQQPATYRALAEESREQIQVIETAMARRDWETAAAIYQNTWRDLATLATATPAGGWEQLGRRITAGQNAEQQAIKTIAQARAALTNGRAQDALDMLTAIPTDQISVDAELSGLYVRRDAITALISTGELTKNAYTAVQAMIEQREASVSAPGGAR